MSFLWVLFIVTLILSIILIICLIKYDWEEIGMTITGFITILTIIIFVVAIIQSTTLKNKAIRQEKEREQIEFQIENLTEDSDKIKLNEWILTYNDWVNDVNTSKEVWGWFSWYYYFDMTNHTIIPLV